MCGKQPVALEHHVGRALFGTERRDVDAGDLDRAGGRRDEAADHAQQRRFAAARRPEHGDEIARIDVEIEGRDGGERAIDLGQAAQAQQRESARPRQRCAGPCDLEDRRGISASS